MIAGTVLTILLTQALTLAVVVLERRYVSRAERKRTVELRAAQASERLLDPLDEVRHWPDVDDDSETRHELSRRMEREVLFLPDEELRRRLAERTLVVWYAEMVEERTGNQRRFNAVTIYRAGHELLGAFLREEKLPARGSSYALKHIDPFYEVAESYESGAEDDEDD